MLTDNTQPAERSALTFKSLYSDADPCDVPDEPQLCSDAWYINDEWNLVAYCPVQWINNVQYHNGWVYLNDLDDYIPSYTMVPYTSITWVDGLPSKSLEDWIEFSFDIDRHPDWAELPF